MYDAEAEAKASRPRQIFDAEANILASRPLLPRGLNITEKEPS